MDRDNVVKLRTATPVTDQQDPPTVPARPQAPAPPRFLNHPELVMGQKPAGTTNRAALINKLNYANFVGDAVFVHLSHREYGDHILLEAQPEPCVNDSVCCNWLDDNIEDLPLGDFIIEHLLLPDGSAMILVPVDGESATNTSLTFRLPETATVYHQRGISRHPGRNVTVDLMQSGFLARGELLDFNPHGFRIKARPVSPSSFHWLQCKSQVIVQLRREDQTLYSGPCRCLRISGGIEERELVLLPDDVVDEQLKAELYRNPRQKLVPSPSLSFIHPLTQKRTQLEVFDISSAGFSVYEDEENGLLVQGMIIPELTVDFSSASSVVCSARVVHLTPEEGGLVRCGLSILDMTIADYSLLAQIMTKARNPHAYTSNRIDVNELWEVFFEAGFIYPSKYHQIRDHHDDLMETYRKLYEDCPEIARHFTYQQNGRILAHMSMLRAYDRTWMIHHHAARAFKGRRAGFVVLKQIIYFLYSIHRMPSANSDYVMCFFRPESRFPNRIFGDYARLVNDASRCSLDLFAYALYPSLFHTAPMQNHLPSGWTLEECSERDVWNMEAHYRHHSGGLLLRVMGIDVQPKSPDSFQEKYSSCGLIRHWRTFSLKRDGELYAVFVTDISDVGLNLSDLLNNIKVMILKPYSLPPDVISIVLGKLTPSYHVDKVPILIYPTSYCDRYDIVYDKQYYVWAHDLRYSDDFTTYAEEHFHLSRW